MPKLDYLQQKKLGPADELREILGRLEEVPAHIKGLKTPQAFDALADLDQIDPLFSQLDPTGLNLLSEQGRWQSLQTRLRKEAGAFLSALGGPAALKAHRPNPAPPPEQWWWHLDALVAQKQRRRRRQIGLVAVVILLAFGGLVVVFQTVLTPSPEVLARLEAENSAFAAIDTGDYQQALLFVEQGLLKAPGDPELLLFQGILLENLGNEAAAAITFDQVQTRFDDPLDFYLSRSQLQLRARQPERAESDARSALERNPDSAEAWLLLGQTLEFQDKLAEAALAYQKANELALASGDNEIVVLARMALGRIGAGP